MNDQSHILIGKAIARSHAIDKLLRKHYPSAKGHGLYAVINSLSNILPAILVRAIRIVANIRNAAAHPDEFKPSTIPSDFDKLCSEIELLIPYFATQGVEASKQPKNQTPKPKNDKKEPNNKGCSGGEERALRLHPWLNKPAE